jgi:two-component system, cell cycle sensor histidine kinase DivJ
LHPQTSTEASVSLSTSIREFLNALVHPSAREDPLTVERHVAFMASRLFGSLLALGVFPVFLAWHGVPTVLEFLVIAWMIFPIATACFLSRTGRYNGAQALSALGLIAIVTTVAANSGGIGSTAAIWLLLIPLEAAVSGSSRVVALAMLLLGGGTGLLIAANPWFGLGPGVAGSTGTPAALGTMSALIYATAIALGANSLVRANFARFGREAEPHLLAAFGPADVITHYGHGDRIIYASANAQAVLGAPACDLADHGLFDRIHITDRPAYLRALSEAAASGGPCEVEFRLRRGAEAEFIWIEMRCRSLPLPYPRLPPRKRWRIRKGEGQECLSGDATSPKVVAVMREVTSRKIRQDALLEARDAALRANAAKSRFLAFMSHELRTPLTAIIGFSDMLREEKENFTDRPRRLEYARIINESGHHLLAVANEILDMSRLETGNFGLVPQPLRLGAVIASCTELLALRAETFGITFKIEAPGSLPEIVADRRAIKHILINLMTNAINFSHPGGIVAVSASVEGQHVLLEVADGGIGIAPDDLTRIGSPFFQVQGRSYRRQDGAGLGLSIVKALVDLHGGELQAHSRLGEGTRMVVRLPLDCTCAELRPPVPIASGSRGDSQKGLAAGLPTSRLTADPSVPQPDAMNSTADLVFPVQMRA